MICNIVLIFSIFSIFMMTISCFIYLYFRFMAKSYDSVDSIIRTTFRYGVPMSLLTGCCISVNAIDIGVVFIPVCIISGVLMLMISRELAFASYRYENILSSFDADKRVQRIVMSGRND